MASLSLTESGFENSFINETGGPRTIGIVCMFLVICSAVLVGRFWARRIRKVDLEADDYLVVAAYVRKSGSRLRDTAHTGPLGSILGCRN